MPLYEYFCKDCGCAFEVLRPMSQVGAPEVCPEGHPGAKKVLSTFATVGTAQPACANPAVLAGASTCCGGGCHLN